MPSIPLSQNISPEKKEKKLKKIKESINLDSSIEKKINKDKKKRNLSDSDECMTTDSEKKKSKKKEKKRKLSEDEDERSETSSETVNLKGKKSKKIELIDEEEEEKEEVEENPNAVSNFRISEPLRNKLRANGIEALFPIQAMTFNIILDGSDLVGRARTGQVITSILFDELVYLYVFINALSLSYSFVPM